MTRANISPSRRTRTGAALVAALLHLLAVFALIRVFTPDFTAGVVRSVTEAFTVTITAPPPPPPSPTPSASAGAARNAGRKAVPKEAAAPTPKIAIAPVSAPPVASTGSADRSGARDSGAGSGAGGQGNGTGSGNGGSGQGGGGATAPVKLSGEINSARDYPRASRDLRIGDHVVVMLTVGTDGRVSACRIHRASRDPEANRITCRLATERFRFRPATDAAGTPVTATFGWQQRWFDPRPAKGNPGGGPDRRPDRINPQGN